MLEFYLRLLSGLTQLWGHTSEKKITVSVVDTVAPTIKMASDVINLDVGQVTSVSYDDLPIEVADKSEIDHNSLSFRKMVQGGTTYPIEKVYDKSSESLKFEKWVNTMAISQSRIQKGIHLNLTFNMMYMIRILQLCIRT